MQESNFALLSRVLSELLDIRTGDSKLDQKLDKAAESLEKSLGQEYWQDENHLISKRGKKVFDDGKKVVKELVKMRKDGKLDESTRLIVENVIQDLLGAYRSIALIAIEEDESECIDSRCEKKIEKRYNELAKGDKEIAKGKPDRAIDKYRKAWERDEKRSKKGFHKDLSGDEQNSAVDTPSEYVLDQNYPNPFNPSTVIGFSIPESGAVKLVVYNSIGEEIEVLANGIYSAGYHTVQFNANNLNNGVYIYRLEAENYASVKKMILVK
jgi:hypothetical protein